MTISRSIIASIIASTALIGCGGNSNSSDSSQSITDTTPPTITNIDAEEKILTKLEPTVITFSEAINPDSAVVSIDRLDDGQFTITWNDASTQLTLTPKTNWPGGLSNLTVEVSDIAGNPLAEPYRHTLNANLTFDLMQSAEVEIGSTTINGETTTFLNKPYGNSAVHNGALWVANHDKSEVLKFNTLPEDSNATPDEKIGYISVLDEEGDYDLVKIHGPQAPFIANNQLFITDYFRSFIAIFDDIPKEGQENQGIILGIPGNPGISATQLFYPEAAIVADGKVFVLDGGNNRLLIWNNIPTESHTPPDLVLGQNSFNTGAPYDDNQDGKSDDVTSARTFFDPSGVWSDGNKLAVIDNNRVLLWDVIPQENFAEADIVLGHKTMVDDVPEDPTQSDINAQTLRPYEGITSNGQQLFIADSRRNRVMIWNTWPTENFQAADQLLGQSDFSKSAANDVDQDGEEDTLGEFPSRALNVLSYPVGLSLNNDTLIVNDYGNNRILNFKSR